MRARSTPASRFDLEATIESGQAFRFDRRDGYYYLRAKERIVRLRQSGDRLEYLGCPQAFVRFLFQLDHDLREVEEALSGDQILRKACRAFRGLRLMRQDPWECLVSFICSQASNIPRIKQNIDALCRLYGHPIELDGFRAYSFPDPGSLGDETEMRRAGLGFRAKYLAQINAEARSLDMDGLGKLSYEEAKASLVELSGVGEKIADCVLLFGYGHPQAFPVGVWIRRVVQDWYFGGRRLSDREIRHFAADRFGQYAGYAQQYLFHYARTRKQTHV